MGGAPSGYLDANRANWDERAALHAAPDGYDLSALRAGRGRLHPIEEAELGEVAGLRVLHLQCHLGADTLTLAQRGAEAVGLDFSPKSVELARGLADELGLADRARFVEADVNRAREAIPEPAAFDLVYVTWGAICWLPEVRSWAATVAWFLKPGGRLYLAEGHPAALVFDDLDALPDGRPGYHFPYFAGEAYVDDSAEDYASPTPLETTRSYSWLHPLGEVVTALLAAGLRLDRLAEHDGVPWRMFRCLEERDGLYRWPGEPWLPLGYSLTASNPGEG